MEGRVNGETGRMIKGGMIPDSGLVWRLEREALRGLLHYGEKSGSQKMVEGVKWMAGRDVPPNDPLFWPAGLLANALAEHLGQWEDGEEVMTALRTVFDKWLRTGMTIYFLDDILSGMALFTLYERTGERRYQKGVERMAEYLLRLSKEAADEKGSLPYRPSQGNSHIYVDSIGMLCPFLVRYGIKFEKREAVDLALTQVNNMLAYGMDGGTGLPYHGYRYRDKIKYGIIGWGRAVGWLLMGISGILQYLPREDFDYQEMEEAFWHLVEAIVPWQKERGSFSWQLEALEGPDDSSATGMIACAVSNFLRTQEQQSGSSLQTVTRKRMAEGMVEKAVIWLGRCEKDGRIYRASGECMGFSQYPQVYGAYPWSLGPALCLLKGEIERAENGRQW